MTHTMAAIISAVRFLRIGWVLIAAVFGLSDAKAGCETDGSTGSVYCGKGNCAIDRGTKSVYCARKVGGGAAVDRVTGSVYCGAGQCAIDKTTGSVYCAKAPNASATVDGSTGAVYCTNGEGNSPSTANCTMGRVSNCERGHM